MIMNNVSQLVRTSSPIIHSVAKDRAHNVVAPNGKKEELVQFPSRSESQARSTNLLSLLLTIQ